MKKKIISLIAVSACAIGCAAALVACGGGDDKGDGAPKKPHTEAQWTAAFNAEIQSPYYKWQELAYAPSAEGGGSYSIMSEWQCDGVNRAYSYETTLPYQSKDYYFKKGSRYYTSKDTTQYFYAFDRITPEAFAEKEENFAAPQKKLIEDVLKQFRDDYDNFVAAGTGTVFLDEDNKFNYASYEKTDTTFTVQGKLANNEVGDITYNAEKVQVSITEENKIYGITVTGVTGGGIDSGKLEFLYQPYTYYSGDGLRVYLDSAILPELAGNKFSLFSIDVKGEGVPEDELRGYKTWADDVWTANVGKRITCVADGTITGDIVLDDIDLSTFTWAEDDEKYGDLTVTNGTYTLSGKYGMFEGNMLEIDITDTIKSEDGKDVVFTYQFYRVSSED